MVLGVALAAVLGAAAGRAILKPAGRVRVLGAVLVPDKRGLRCAVPLAGCGAGKEKARPGRAGLDEAEKITSP